MGHSKNEGKSKNQPEKEALDTSEDKSLEEAKPPTEEEQKTEETTEAKESVEKEETTETVKEEGEIKGVEEEIAEEVGEEKQEEVAPAEAEEEEKAEEKKREEAPEEEIVEERIYTIPLSRAWISPRKKRTPRAVHMVRSFVQKHMKIETGAKTEEEEAGRLVISDEVNRKLWSRGIEKPPRKIRVRAVKDKEGTVTLYLAEGD